MKEQNKPTDITEFTNINTERPILFFLDINAIRPPINNPGRMNTIKPGIETPIKATTGFLSRTIKSYPERPDHTIDNIEKTRTHRTQSNKGLDIFAEFFIFFRSFSKC